MHLFFFYEREVRFAHIYALQLAQKGSILEKKMGYLACALFLSESDDLILLLVNTIMRDLGSKNIMVNFIFVICQSGRKP